MNARGHVHTTDDQSKRTIALSAILLKPIDNTEEVSFFSLRVLDSMLERV